MAKSKTGKETPKMEVSIEPDNEAGRATAEIIMEKLGAEFAPEDLKILPKGGKSFLHADPRAYVRRLDEAVGPTNWRADYSPPSVTVGGEFGWRKDRNGTVTMHAGKVIIGCSVIITGLGTRTDVGEAWLEDDNAATVAAAQAFKRACAGFGLGAYLYKLNKQQGKAKNTSNKKPASSKGKIGDRLKAQEAILLGTQDQSQLLKYFFFIVPDPKKVTLDIDKKFNIDLFKAAVKDLPSEEKEARMSRVEAIVGKYQKDNDLPALIEKVDKAVSEQTWG